MVKVTKDGVSFIVKESAVADYKAMGFTVIIEEKPNKKKPKKAEK